MTKAITEYFDCPATRALSEKYGSMLEQKLTGQDKLDALWVIATAIGFSEAKGEIATLRETQEEWGALIVDTPYSEEFLSVIDGTSYSILDLLNIIRILAKQLSEGDYIDG